MSDGPAALRPELEKMRRVADQLCTSHAILRDRYAGLAFALDVATLFLSAWVTILGFIDPALNVWLTPFGMDERLWIGLLGAGLFLLTLFQFKADWRGRSEAHGRTFGMYVEVKREAGYLLAISGSIPGEQFLRLASRYDMASDVGTGIPEKHFLALKRAHRLKVALSKRLDDTPGASIWLVRAAMVLGDTVTCLRTKPEAPEKTEKVS